MTPTEHGTFKYWMNIGPPTVMQTHAGWCYCVGLEETAAYFASASDEDVIGGNKRLDMIYWEPLDYEG